jgi:hypothetical protein
MSDARTRIDSLGAWLLKLGTVLIIAGCAAGAPLAQTEFAESSADDPPARVGHISYVAGPVRLTDLRDNESEAASINWPITSQHRISTGRTGRAEVRIGSLAVRIDDDSDVDFGRVDDEAVQIVVHRGSLALRVRNRDMLRELELLTPRERIVLDDVGRYRVDVDRAGGITAISTLNGYARIAAGPMNFVVRSGQRAEITGQPATAFQLVAYVPDSFDDWVAGRDHRDDAVQSRRHLSEETTGIEALDAYGYWRQYDAYGTVWFPSSVPAGWAPYRHGRWAWIAPWGWTWIDEAPWGFAPSHYGRWVFVDGYWGWAPGLYVARPVYSPALVGWFGAPGVSVSIGIGQPVGWFPLGWREVYVPCYPVSRRYVNYINAGQVINITQITIIRPPVHFIHQRPGHATWAPGDALTRRLPINKVVQTAPPDWTRLPTRVQPPIVVSGDRSRKRIVSTQLAPSDIARPQPIDRAPAPRSPATATPPGARPIERTPATDGRAFVGRPQAPTPAAPSAQPQPKVAPTPPATARPNAPATGQPPGYVRPPAQVPRGVQEPRAGDAAADAPRPPKRGLGTNPENNPQIVRPQPRVDAPRPEAPRVEVPRAVAPPRAVQPRVEAPRVEAPRVEPPRVEAPRRIEAPRFEAARPEPARPQPKPRADSDDRQNRGGGNGKQSVRER